MSSPPFLYSQHGLLSCYKRVTVWLCPQKALLQAVTRLECEGLHVALVSRFVYNCLHFGRQVQSILAMLQPEPPDAATPAAAPDPGPAATLGHYRPILEVCQLRLQRCNGPDQP